MTELGKIHPRPHSLPRRCERLPRTEAGWDKGRATLRPGRCLLEILSPRATFCALGQPRGHAD